VTVVTVGTVGTVETWVLWWLRSGGVFLTGVKVDLLVREASGVSLW
jgi:hypothetical protein